MLYSWSCLNVENLKHDVRLLEYQCNVKLYFRLVFTLKVSYNVAMNDADAKCFCEKSGIGVDGVTCRDCPRDYGDNMSLIDELGGTVAVAKLCRVSPQAVSQWRINGIPYSRLMYLEVIKPRLDEVKKNLGI